MTERKSEKSRPQTGRSLGLLSLRSPRRLSQLRHEHLHVRVQLEGIDCIGWKLDQYIVLLFLLEYFLVLFWMLN